MILAIETSCDDTCAAVFNNGKVLSSIVSSQDSFHARYGGVVPEVASRHHLELVNPVVDDALREARVSIEEITKVAVTRGPGLIGALLVGVATAKALAAASGLRLIPVNHLEGHIAANYIGNDPMEPPFVCLIASGGHTLLIHVTTFDSYRLLGQTMDDAAGEALDKGARLLGLKYPGGAELDSLASAGDPTYTDFPVGLDKRDNIDFSFSGVKTSLYYFLKEHGSKILRQHAADIAASYQSAIVSALVKKTIMAAELSACDRICLSGGVSANTELRQRLEEACADKGFRFRVPSRAFCTDNAAMIASAARYIDSLEFPEYLGLSAYANARFAA